jgi:hypothetical protein
MLVGVSLIATSGDGALKRDDGDTCDRATFCCLSSFVEILHEVGFNNGLHIDEAFYNAHISGRHNPDITSDLFPDWSEERREQFADDKEARFRTLAGEALLTNYST